MTHPVAKAATLAVHADDVVNNVTDVAPPIHLSTTFRYHEDPSKLISAAERDVSLSIHPFFLPRPNSLAD